MAIRPIDILIRVRDEFSGALTGMQSKLTLVAAAVAAAFGVSLFKGAVTSAAELEAQLSDVQAVSGATKDEMLLLRAAAEEAGASTKFTATEAAQALGNLARSGLSAKESIAALPATLSLAQAGSIDLAQASDIMTSAMAGFGLKGADAGRVADLLAMGANASKTSVRGLGEALSYAAPTASAMGISLESTLAIIGKFADGGIDASRAGTALNAILSQFGDPASSFRRELAGAGITTTNFETALVQLAGAGDKGKNAIRAVGTEAAPALQSLINQGVPALEALRQKLVESSGSAEAFAKQVADNLTGATDNLSSSWDALKIALGTPVLPVLKDAVNELATSLRNSVSDGTVGKFGEAIAKGFQAASEWAGKFLAEVDFAAIAQSLRNGADQVGAAFDEIKAKAENAGDIVRLVWGAMSAGVNTVLAAVFGLGSAFAEVASKVQSGLALIFEGIAKISFGVVSESYRLAANEVRLSAEATGAAADALAEKARQALAGMEKGAQMARDGFAGLTGETTAAEDVATRSKPAFDALGQSVGGVANQDKLNAFKALEDTTQKVGDKATQATGKVQELGKATQKIGTDAQDAAAKVKSAFVDMGIQTKQELTDTATKMKSSFELVRDSGNVTADDLQKAFKKMADAAVASGDAGAIAFAKSQAAAQGYTIEVDAAGKATVVSMKDAAAAAEATARSFGQAKEAVSGYAEGVAQAAEQLRKLQALQGLAGAGGDLSGVSTEDLKKAQADLLKQGGALSSKEYIKLRNELVGRQAPTTDKNGFSLDKAGNRLVMGSELATLTGVKNFLEQAGLTAEKAKEVALEFSDGKGAIPYFSNPGQLKYGGRNSNISQALLMAAEKTTFAPTPPNAPLPPGASGSRTVVVELRNSNGGIERITTDEDGSAALLRSLQNARLSSR